MTKKFLAALIALSMVGVYACDSDDDSDSCTTGTYKCDGTKAIACVNGAWQTPIDCATSGMVCDVTAGCKKAGTTCDAAAIAACVGGGGTMDANCQCQSSGQPQGGCTDAQKTACTAAGGTLDASCMCQTGGTPSQDIPATCTKGSSPAVCGKDGNAYFCGDTGYYLGKTCDAANPCYVCDNGYGGCGDKATQCKSGGGDNKDLPSDIPTSCTKKESPAVCGKDGNAYFCGDTGYYLGRTCDASNPCYVCDNGYGGCGDKATECKSGGGGSDELCTASSTSGCKKNCSNDKSVGYYWNGSKLVTVNCANNDCIIDSQNHVVCESGGSSSGGDLPSDVPTTCTKGTSPAFCASDGNAYFCGNDGYYFGKKCDTSNPCYVCDNGYGGCGDKATQCKSGGSEQTELPANIPASCVQGESKGLCGSDGGAYVCGDKGTYYKNTKCSGTCYECGDGYWVACGADKATACAGHDTPAKDCSSASLITEGGSEGDCCDNTKYVPSCEKMLRCDSSGHVAVIKCDSGTTCKLSTNGKKNDGSNYDTSKYPLGYFECI